MPRCAGGIVELLSGAFIEQPSDLVAALQAATEQAQARLTISRLSPNTLFSEATQALLTPETRTLGLVFYSQLQGAVSAPHRPSGRAWC